MLRKPFKLILPLQNHASTPIRVLLEPLSEYFIIQPGEAIEVCATSKQDLKDEAFTIAPNDSFLTIYAPGPISEFVDCYVVKDGVRLIPDGDSVNI